MQKLISTKITGLGIRQKYTDNPDVDFYEAVKAAAEDLQKENLHYATVSLFDDENDTFDKAVKQVEISRNK